MRVRPRTRSRSRLTRPSSAMQSEIPSRTLGAAEAVTVPKARLVAGAGVSPEQRSVFLREPPAFPGWLLILLFAGAGAQLGNTDGWGWIAGAAAIGLWDSVPAASIMLLVLLPATAWAGLAPPRPAPTDSPVRPTRIAVPLSGGSTRRGVQLAVHASSAPMIGVYDGRVFEMNKSAEAFVGQLMDQCVGRPVAELLRLDPPSALDAAYPAAERHALVTLERPEAGMSPVKARIRGGRSGGRAAIAGVALAPNPEYG